MKNSLLEIARVERSKESARDAYNRMSAWYDWIAGSSERKFAEAGLQKLAVQAGETVLEIGFGTGHNLVTLARSVGITGKVYGIDLSEGMMQVANQRLSKNGLTERAELTVSDATHLPYNDGFFNAIFMSFVLELFDTPEIPMVLQECHRTLCKGGRIGIVALSKKTGAAVRVYEWFHARLPAYVDCRPIFTRQSVEAADFRVTDLTEMKMWGLPVDILIASKF